MLIKNICKYLRSNILILLTLVFSLVIGGIAGLDIRLAIMIVMMVIGVVFILRWTSYMIPVLFFLLPIEIIFFSYAGIAFSTTNIAIVVGLFAIFVRQITATPRILFGKNEVFSILMLLVFLVFAVLSVLLNDIGGPGKHNLLLLTQQLLLMSTYLLLLLLFPSALNGSINAWFISISVFMASVSIYSFATQSTISFGIGQTTPILYTLPSGYNRAGAFFGGDPNALATPLMMGSIFGLSMVFGSRKRTLSILYSLLTTLTLVGLFLTFSRGGIAGFLFGCFILLTLTYKKKWFRWLVLIVFVAFLVWIVLPYYTHFTTAAYIPNLAGRINIWLSSLDVWKHSIWIGTGYDTVRFVTYQTMGSKLLTLQLSAHNVYLEILASTGLLGFIPFLLLIIQSLLKGFQSITMMSRNDYQNSNNKYLLVGVISAFIGFLAKSFFDSFLDNTAIMGSFWVFLALLAFSNRFISDLQPKNR